MIEVLFAIFLFIDATEKNLDTKNQSTSKGIHGHFL